MSDHRMSADNRLPPDKHPPTCGCGASPNGCGRGGETRTVCVETNRILDSCRDQDCFENVRVFLTDLAYVN
jgi:hypothetical protein